MEKPEINVCYMVTAAETKEEAEYQAKPQDITGLWLSQGRIAKSLTPEEAKGYPLTEMDKMKIQQRRPLHIVGAAKEVAEKLQAEQEMYGFDEAMIVSIPHSRRHVSMSTSCLRKNCFNGIAKARVNDTLAFCLPKMYPLGKKTMRK
ncbi:hypothetical protein [Salinicoccus roseus]|uniref:hypothetical protein n=1 Tax=Salinicoccus roseus TaxID=45670 RepID=UPI0015C6F2D2|nr:hypothetical protein [Salinicoccus roseus]